MKCKMYTTSKANTYVIVPSTSDISVLPPSVRNQIVSSKPLKEIDVDPAVPLIALDPQEVHKNIKTYGYHVQGVSISFQESV